MRGSVSAGRMTFSDSFFSRRVMAGMTMPGKKREAKAPSFIRERSKVER